MYRITPTGIENDSGVGAGPDVLTSYISQVRAAIANTALSGASIGHVDTWTAWVNGSNSAVIEAVDWLGVDAYPFFQNTMSNGIAQGAGLLESAISETTGAAQGKPVWVTETGWPVSGDQENEAVASVENAKTFWDEAGCPLFGSTNIWWYTLQDAAPTTPNPSFGIIGSTLTTTPLYDLSCSDTTTNTSTSTTAASSTAASSSAAQPSSAAQSSASAAVPPTVSSSSAGVFVGGGGAAGSSQTTLTTNPVNTVVSTPATAPTTTVGSSVGSGSGSGLGAGNSTSASTGRGGATTTASGGSTTTSGAVVVTNAGVALSGSIGAGFAAIMAAILAL